MGLEDTQGVCRMKDLKIRWRLHGPEWEPTTRQRGINVYRQLQSLGYNADAWDGKEEADIIILQYSMRMLDDALATGATVVADINDQVFAKHHSYHAETMRGLQRVPAVVAGSPRLAEHLERLHPFVRMIEEGVDSRYFGVERQKHDGINLAWTGMNDNLTYFDEIDGVLAELSKQHKFTVHIVCPPLDGFGKSNKAKVQKKPYKAVFHEWTMETLLEQMALADIAVTPLFQQNWCWCKCANKMLSFMAAGLPVVSPDVPSYRAVGRQGIDCFLCYHEKDWQEALTMLLTSPKLRSTIGKQARKTAQGYSVEKIAEQWLQLFREVRPR
jgi:glycosyltransferase involved in cell wall biosynthesis